MSFYKGKWDQKLALWKSFDDHKSLGREFQHEIDYYNGMLEKPVENSPEFWQKWRASEFEAIRDAGLQRKKIQVEKLFCGTAEDEENVIQQEQEELGTNLLATQKDEGKSKK